MNIRTNMNETQIPPPSCPKKFGAPGSEQSKEPKAGYPLVKFDGTNGILMIKGNVNSDLYRSLLTLVREHFATYDKLTCYFLFKDFDSITIKALFDLCKILKMNQDKGKKVKINWFADWQNRDMIETGIDFSDLFDMPFNILPV